MAVTFSEACERDIRRARYVRVAVYPEVKDWLPVQVRRVLATGTTAGQIVAAFD